MFALPSDTENSDTEQDDGAYEELNKLSYNDKIESSEPRSASTSHAACRQSSADVTTAKDTSEPRSASTSHAHHHNFICIEYLHFRDVMCNILGEM